MSPESVGRRKQRGRRSLVLEFVVELHEYERSGGFRVLTVAVRGHCLLPDPQAECGRRAALSCAPVTLLCEAVGDDWLALTPAVLPVGEVTAWAVRPECGAVVAFSGIVRDHAEGRVGVT